MNLTEGELQTLRHMLGINTPDAREPEPYRNYYAAAPGDARMAALAARGAVRRIPDQAGSPGLEFFECTEAGRRAAIASHRSIRKGKKQRVYRRFLSVRDGCPDLTFLEFLVSPDFAEARARA